MVIKTTKSVEYQLPVVGVEQKELIFHFHPLVVNPQTGEGRVTFDISNGIVEDKRQPLGGRMNNIRRESFNFEKQELLLSIETSENYATLLKAKLVTFLNVKDLTSEDFEEVVKK